MKKLKLILPITLFLLSIQASAFQGTIDSILENDEITEFEAIELGMTEIPRFNFSFFESLKIDDEHVRNQLNNYHSYVNFAPVVLVIDKGVRSAKNLDGQTITAFKDGVEVHKFDVSTGTEQQMVVRNNWGWVKKRYIATTPYGYYRPSRVYHQYSSKLFSGANMDYAVFISGGVALHTTSKAYYKYLGRRSSGGCVRLTRENAKTINELVIRQGTERIRVKDVSFRHKGKYLKRTQYINRVELPDLDYKYGTNTQENIKGFDVLIIVKNSGV